MRRLGGGRRPLTVLVVDDSAVVRARLVGLASTVDGVLVVGEAADARTALELAAQCSPHVVLLDIHLPDRDGLDVLRQLKQSSAPPFAIIVSNHASEAYRRRAAAYGAERFLDKSADFQELLQILDDLRRSQSPA
jgi:DNA-binding NarL/FixJ family response regulator